MLLASLTAAILVGYAASTVLPIRGVHDRIVRGALFRGPPDSIALTFDDGPHPERTPAILDLLARTDAKATFFLIGAKVARYPDIVKRIADDGHVIGNHSWSHAWLPGLSSQCIESQLARCQEALWTTTNRTPRLVRPPYGSRDFRFYLVAERLGLTPVLWSHDSLDWAGAGDGLILNRLRRAAAGDIVLLHDGSPRAGGTIPALDQWLQPPTRRHRLEPLSEARSAPREAGW